MNVFTIHLPPEETASADPLPIREGFCWPAFFFTFVWALWHRMWLVGTAIFLVLTALSVGLELSGIAPAARLVLTLGTYFLLGLMANDIRRWQIERSGWDLDDIVSGQDADEAVWRWAHKTGQAA